MKVWYNSYVRCNEKLLTKNPSLVLPSRKLIYSRLGYIPLAPLSLSPSLLTSLCNPPAKHTHQTSIYILRLSFFLCLAKISCDPPDEGRSADLFIHVDARGARLSGQPDFRGYTYFSM